MSGQPKKIRRKPSRSATCCIADPGSVMAMNRRPASVAPTSRSTRSKKYCFRMFGSSVDPDLLETMKSVRSRSTACSNASHLRRVRRIEHVQLGKAVGPAERLPHHFGTEARSSHPEQQDMGEAGAPRHVGDPGQSLDVGQLPVGDAEPAEPPRFILAAPDRGIAPPESSHLALCFPFGQRGLDRGGEGLRQRGAQAVDAAGARRFAPRVDSGQELREGIREELHAVGQQLVGHLLHGDARAAERRHRVERGVDVLLKAGARPAVIAKRVEGRRRYRVDGVRPDQFLDVEHIAIGGVLRARARPEQPLRLSALAGQGAPACAADDLQVPLVGQPGVGDGHLAGEAAKRGPLLGSRLRLQPLRHERVHGGVDPADEEAGHTRHARQVAAPRGELLQARHVRVRDLLVRVLREEQRHVDIDPLGDELLDGGNALGRRRNLDHHIGVVHGSPQSPGLDERPFRVVGEERRDLQADVPITCRGGVVHGAQRIGRVLDVADGQPFIERLGVQRLRLRRFQQVRVVGAPGDRFFEDRRIRRDAPQAVHLDQAAQFAAGHEAAANVVQPHRLAEDLERADGIVARGHLRDPTSCDAHDFTSPQCGPLSAAPQ